MANNIEQSPRVHLWHAEMIVIIIAANGFNCQSEYFARKTNEHQRRRRCPTRMYVTTFIYHSERLMTFFLFVDSMIVDEIRDKHISINDHDWLFFACHKYAEKSESNIVGQTTHYVQKTSESYIWEADALAIYQLQVPVTPTPPPFCSLLDYCYQHI